MKNRKRFISLILVVSLILCCFTIPAFAQGEETAESVQSATRASGRFNMTVKAGAIAKANTSFSLEKDDEVTIKASYAPASAAVNFGLIGPDDQFYYIPVTTGSIDETIKVNQHGEYTLAIENTSNVSITVNGTVTY